MLRCIYTLNFMKIHLIFQKRQIGYFKSRILKLEKNKTILEILCLYLLNMLNFKNLTLIATEI